MLKTLHGSYISSMELRETVTCITNIATKAINQHALTYKDITIAQDYNNTGTFLQKIKLSADPTNYRHHRQRISYLHNKRKKLPL